MPHKNAFIIDEDREFAKRVAAALRDDQLKVGIAEGERDPLDESADHRPDIILMRAEGREGESGYALCSRMKRLERFDGLPIFLYSAEADDQTFEHHRQQDGAADAYIRFPPEPPYPMDDLKAQVEGVLFDDSRSGSDVDVPPPLPAAEEPIKPITEEDNAFLDRVLDSLQQGTSDEESAAIPPLRPSSSSSSMRRTTADAKLDMLRQKLRQREFELAKVMEMYRAKEREYHEWNEKLVEKDVEAQALRVTIEDLQRTAEAAQSELDRRTSEFNASFEQLLDEKVSRENELIHAVAAKEKDLADAHSRLLRSQRESDRISGELKAALSSAEQSGETHREVLSELQVQLEERDSTLASVEQALADTQDRVHELEATQETLEATVNRKGAEVLQLQNLVLDLRGDLADAREAYDEALAEREFDVQAYEEIVQGLRIDLDEAEASFAQVEGDLKGEVSELSIDLQAHTERLRSTVAAQAALEGAYRALQLETSAQQVDLTGRLTRLSETLAAERNDRAEAEARLDTELRQGRSKIAGLQESIADLEMVSGERIRVLSEQVEERDQTLDEERDHFREVEATLKEAVADLESRRQGLQNEVNERLADLAEAESTHADAIAARDAEQARLEGELRVANDEVASLNAEIAEVQNHLEELEQIKAEMETEFQLHFEEQVNTLNSTREAAGQREAQLRDQIANLSADLVGRGEQIDELTVQLETERRERDDAERIIATLQLDLEGARGELLNTRQAVREKEELVSELRETLAVRDGRIVELQGEQTARQDAQAELGQLRVEHDARNEKIGRLEGQLAAEEKARETLHAELEAAKEAVIDLRAQLAVAQSTTEERSTRLDEARREWTVTREELLAERQQLTARLETLQSDLEDTRSTRDALAAENARLEEQRDSVMQREEELRVDLDARTTHAVSIDRELEVERTSRRSAERTVAELKEQLTAKGDVEIKLRDLGTENEHVRRALSTELEQAKAQIESLTSQIDALSAARDGLGDEATELSRRLDDAMARSATLASQKADVEEQRVSDVRKLEQQLKERDSELAQQQREVARLGEELVDVRREREEVENKYVRELEELHDEYMQKAQETDAGHAREVENLRKAALDAKRQLKTSQLATQRLEDRLRRAEAERPNRSDASADFESFIAQFSDGPTANRGSGGRRNRTGPVRPVAANASRPPPRAAAEALASSAVVPANADKEDEVTDVGGQSLSPPNALRSSGKASASTRNGEPDDFLAAFDKEFEDIKGG